ncbi:multidrug efflux pump subunit AcrB [Wenyingzhuangia heitensis]|uniref:Multidrug efflux pump subunit AcrB n=1 Tax=Wenyingzhuangia heitensis TaxID=1487859 RepID=A0ABX0UFC9_9FLAO|nr:efflux RND transporter permease subunit [Wenyingzhuangia heitensis]NIJ46580.1 multidrug efflux pump subunit AcrB [Wenyingzhuangia heitensis]
MKLKLSTFTTLTIFGCLFLVGLCLIPILSVQLVPSRKQSSLNIIYSWKNASAKVIEQEVTSKLEGIFNTINGVKSIRSSSSKGKGRVSLTLKKNIDKDALRFEIANLIRQNYDELPEGVSYPRFSMSFSEEFDEITKSILSYSINANESPYYIKKYAEKKILPKISEIENVNEVIINGATSYEWVIKYRTNQLIQLNMTASDISKSIKTHFQERQIGIGVDVSNVDFQEKSLQLIFNTDQEIEWSNIPIKKIEDRIIYLTDIANVTHKEAEVERYYRTNGLNSVNLIIYPEKGTNTIELAKRVKKEINGFRENLFRDGYSLKLTRDSTEFLSEEIQKIERRTLYSLLILLILTLVINRSLKYMLLLFCSIIINLSIAVILYYFMDIELQMYSFAGITISFGIVIDNSIIMIDHLRKKGDKKVFKAILASTMTTIAALLIIFFLKEEERANLWDFALVIASNIAVSLIVSLYFVPALLDKFELNKEKKRISLKIKKRIVLFNNIYRSILSFFKIRLIKCSCILILILGFGIPIHLFPEKMEEDKEKVGFGTELYNKTFGNRFYYQEIKPTLEKVIGGALRLFTENVFENSYSRDPEKTVLRVSAEMPEGCTIEQLNEVVERMENQISQYDEVSLFETNIRDPQNSSITIYFKDKFELTNFPYELKDALEYKAIGLGGATWRVTGVGEGFSNSLREGPKSERINLQGYNYDELYRYAIDFKEQLLQNSNSRVKEVDITNGGRYSKSLNEFYLNFDLEKVADVGMAQNSIYGYLKNQVYLENVTSIVYDDELQNVKLVADNHDKFNVWDLKNTPLWIKNKQYKLSQLAEIDKRKTGNTISKRDQQYNLTIAYDFVGTYQLSKKFRKDNIKEFQSKLAIGYSIGNGNGGRWNKEDTQQYISLVVVILIIFFICSILLESLRQPFAIISIIPISFIGVFLTFYLFEYNFDQGGYTSFILLSGISVNSCLYIVNDYNNLKKQFPNRALWGLYFKAFNYKIIPVLLTIISTIAGLIPFLWDGQKEVFWFSFAVGSIGGLIFSLIGIFIYLPLFILKKEKNRHNEEK